jgi:glycosyltransferase involved in cell wall biosynthesis
MLARENEDLYITLVGPSYFEDNSWPDTIKAGAEKIEEERFRIVPINMQPQRWLTNGWLSLKLSKIMIDMKPDLIYLIGFEVNNIIYQLALTKLIFNIKSKIVGFTMRGYPLPLDNLHFRFRWKLTTKIYDAIFCHYKGTEDILTNQGKYKKPIYLQTQIGVDKNIHYPDAAARNKIREKLGITNEFVFGTAGRILEYKGIFNLIDALPEKGNWKLLMLGDGNDLELLKQKIRKKGYEDSVILPGYITIGEGVAQYMNAMDCFIHIPIVIDTFPVAVVQAMATALPVIGSNSGAVPYQLGPDAPIVESYDIEGIRSAMEFMFKNPLKAKEIGRLMYERVLNNFEIQHLSKCFNVTIRDILKNEYNPKHIDQANFLFD